MGGTINEQYPVGVTREIVLEQQIRDLKAELDRHREASGLVLKRNRTHRDKLIAERDQLRAELAAAKEAIEDIERTLEIAEIPKYGSSGDRIPWNERVELLADENTALAAHVERLELALKMWRVIPFVLAEFGDHGELAALSPVYYHNSMSVTKEALAATPAQSLASVKGEALREVANLIRQTTPEPVDGMPETFGEHEGRMYAIEQIESEADRIEKDGANG